MKIKRFFAVAMAVAAFSYLGAVSAASLNGGDAATADAADTFVDIVFSIDTSGSMGDEAAAISNNVENAVVNLQCPGIDVWVRARFVGIDGTWGGTLFDEVGENVLGAGGDPNTIDDNEDNGPAVLDFINAQNFWQGPAVGGQRYVRAIVTIGDEGLEDGAPGNTQADYDIGKQANDAAIAGGVVLFAIIGNNPNPGVVESFTALAQGGATLGGHQFNDTGGFAIDSTDPNLQTRLEEVFCRAATVGRPRESTPIPTLSAWGMVGFTALMALFGYVGIRRLQS